MQRRFLKSKKNHTQQKNREIKNLYKHRASQTKSNIEGRKGRGFSFALIDTGNEKSRAHNHVGVNMIGPHNSGN